MISLIVTTICIILNCFCAHFAVFCSCSVFNWFFKSKLIFFFALRLIGTLLFMSFFALFPVVLLVVLSSCNK